MNIDGHTITTQPTFETNNVIYFEVNFTDGYGNLITPTGITYQVKNNSGTQMATGTPTNISTGKYYAQWRPTVEDDYIIKFSGTYISYGIVIRRKFRVQTTD